jgi:hypothetical protein
MLLISGLMDHPLLQDVLQPQLDALGQALRRTGLGMSDYFLADGDDTAAALAILYASGRPAPMSILEQFAYNNHFCAYAGELQPSLSVTAHAVHALRMAGHECTQAQTYILERQLSDGRWCSDKWNGSWLYTTGQVIVALLDSPHTDALERALTAILNHQNADGGWGDGQSSTIEETAYGVLALRALMCHGMEISEAEQALACAERWLLRNYRPFDHDYQPCWLGKETYMPRRIVRMIQLVATFPSSELAVPLRMAKAVGDMQVDHSTEREFSENGAALLRL